MFKESELCLNNDASAGPAAPLKVALKVKMISAALHIIITLHISNESACFEHVVEWTV